MKKIQTKLKYAIDSLEPNFSKESMKTHYEQHYKGYVKNLRTMIRDTHHEDSLLSDIVSNTSIDDPMNWNAGQIINHDLFFDQFDPLLESTSDVFKQEAEKSFDSISNMKKTIDESVMKHFGSGWVWLIMEQRIQWDSPHLTIKSTPNGRTFTNISTDNHFEFPLIAVDVWEHAYYVDHKSNRAQYMKHFWKVLDWRVVVKRYRDALNQVVDYTKPFEL